MVSDFAIFSVVFFLLFIGIVFPPPEFYGLGLTIESLFSFFIGDENLHFTYYHIRLTTTRVCVHSLFIPIYYMVAALAFDVISLQVSHLLLSFLPCCISGSIALYWWSGGSWNNHPLSKVLGAHASHSIEWRNVANALSVEFCRVDKFVHGKSWGKIVVTDNWIVRCGLYVVSVAYQPDVHMSIQNTEEHIDASHVTTQYININVSSVNNACADFKIRLNATDFSDLKNKVTGTILNVRNVVFAQSLSDRFEEAFRKEVSENGLYYSREAQQDECIGCLFAVSDVKLSKLCEDQDAGDCKNCLCRPMWCLRCMAKWFANRQDQKSPERWLSGKAPCPTCRSKFCLRDVQQVA